MSDLMITKPSIICLSAVLPTRGGNVRRPRAYLARALFPLLVLAIIVLPGFAFGALCPPGTLDCPEPPPVLIVPDCSTPPGLTSPPEAPSVLQALPDPIVPAADGGQLLPGKGHVSATGEYEYRIPVDVPAGRAGMQPSLALAYGSRGRNGHIGVGWRLEGLSEINRCAKTFATEGYADGVHFDKNDSFCLDGHKLIAVSGTYGEEGTEYRTEDDTFARIRSHVTSGIGVTSFSVETRDGRVRTYAPPPPAPHVTTMDVAAWPIQEEHDRSGNSILYSYFGTASVESPASAVEYYPSRIDYNTITVNDAAKSGPRNVQFVYEDRLDTASVYVSNAQVRTSQRLKSILLSAPNPVTSEFVWRYDLTYDPGAGSGTGASRLVRVRRCGVQHDGTTGGCFNTKQFTWNNDVQGPKYTKETFPDYGPQNAISLVGDFSGNGRSSVLRGDTIKLRETGDPSHPLSRELNCQGLVPGTDLFNARLVDIYGDGRTRILAPVDVGSYYYYFIIDVDRVQSSNPNDPAVCELSYNAYVMGETGEFGGSCLHVTDLNGDGLTDLIKGERSNSGLTWDWYYRLNALQPNPQMAWVFGPKQSAPGHHPPAQSDGSLVYRSFSRDDGNHRGMIFPAAEPHYDDLAGFGLSANGAAYVADPSTGVHPGYQGWNTYVIDGDKAGYADTDGDGIRNVVYFSDSFIHFEREHLSIDWIGLDHGDLTEWHLESADLDSDGRDDLMLVHKGDRKVLLFQSDAQGNIHESLAPFLAPSAIGDFDGDGLLDLLVKADRGQSADSVTVYHQTGVGTPDRIVAVNNAGDPGDSDPSAREAIVYSNTQFADVGATCKYPQRCMRQGFAVVREHDVYQGADLAKSGPPIRRHLYSYEDPRFDVRGRGFLGFGTVREWDADRGAETTTTYDNSTSDDNGIHLVYPGVLKPKTILRAVPMDVSGHPAHGNANLSRIEYSYKLVRLNQGQTYFVHPLAWDALDWEEEVAIDYGDAARVHVTEIDGGVEKPVLRRRQGSYLYDDYGNQREAHVVTLHGVSTKTVSTYNNDTVNWLVGQLKTTDVTTSEYGKPAPVPQHKDYDYDARGLLCHVYTEQNYDNSAIPQLVTFTHDSEGLVSAVTTSAKGKPLRTVHMAYEPTERVYPSETWNDLGQASWTLFDPARGVSLASEDANGLQVHYRYDDLGRMIQAVPEGQSPVELSYAPRMTAGGALIGTSTYSVMATGSESRTDQDILGRAVGRGHRGFDGSWIEEATGYDLLGRIITVARPDVNVPSNQVTEYTYDNLDRPLEKTLPGGGAVEYSHTFSSSMRSDTFTDRETIRDLDGRVIHSVEDARNTRMTTSFIYGPFNQLDHVTDPKGNQISFTYDQRGRRSSISDPDAGTTIFHYNGFGDVTSKTASGDLTAYFYDLLGRLWQTSHASELTTHTWDTHGAGRLAHTESPDGVEQDFKYNALGQLDTLTYTVGGEDFGFQMAYDGLGRVINIAYPEVASQSQRFSIGRAYNPWGYLGAVYDPSSFTYDPYWRVDGRNADDQLTHVTLGDHTTGTRYYDPYTGILSDIIEGNAVSLAYEYYLDGSLERRQDSLANRDERFGYDALHRLKTWGLHNNPEVGYNYDDLGNLTEVVSKPTPWTAATVQEKNTYGTNGKPHALTVGPQGAYTYDARGRQDTAPGRALVTYNERDLPRKITKTTGGDTLFEYDAGGTRVKKQGPSETVITLSGLYERRTKTGHNQHVFYVPGGDEGPVARVVSEEGDALANATTTYLHHDPRLGSVAAVTDASGTLQEPFYYEPFGRRTDAQGNPLANAAIDVTKGFTGHEHDDELGLINMRGRMYDPIIRRFLSADPHVTDPLSGQNYNRYSYVVNNPTNLTDPTGFDWWDFGGGSWNSDGCLGQECGGSGVATSSGVDYGFGGYSGSPNTGTPSGGNSGSMVAGGGYGVPVAASEDHRQVSVPTGPAAPGVTISGPVVKPETDGGDGAGGAPPEEPWWHGEVATLKLLQKNCPDCVNALEVTRVAGALFMAAQDLQQLKNAVRDVPTLGKEVNSARNMATLFDGRQAPTPRAETLYHYTTEESLVRILKSAELNPSLKAFNPADARYGNGQYLSDIIPGSASPAQLSRAFLGQPFQGSKFTHFLEIRVNGLEVVQGRPGVFVIPNEAPLDVSGRIFSFGAAQ